MSKISRRSFGKKTIIATGAISMPLFSIGRAGASANSIINIAGIGVGGRGGANLKECSNENIVALCDVNQDSAKGAFSRYADAKQFKDFRVMFDKMSNDIDAVIVATPDHTHFVAAMAAMQNGKHVYVEKPLAHNVWQVRTLKKAARYYKIISQMGNQGHATDGIRSIKEWYDAGLLGNVTEVLAWFNGPNFTGSYFSKPENYPPAPDEVPETLDWDLWLGPAKDRHYSKSYLPRHWRGWFDFGNGELGDWACHTLDGPFWALDLGMPTMITADKCSEAPRGFTPDNSIIRFEFPARGDKSPVTLRWHDGGNKPDLRPEWGLEKLPGSGMIMVGDKLSLMTGGRPNDPKLLPNDAWEAFKKKPLDKTIPRVDGGPWGEWLSAIKGDGPMPGSNFDYASELVEMSLLGVMAQRFNTTIEWNAKAMRVTNHRRLNRFVKEPVRKGWETGEEVWKA